ncbi:MAG: class I tRNA ligase family protein, partial [Synergistes sp.]|nr:class I tRNA ligase family protein [Synergistes sp.]
GRKMSKSLGNGIDPLEIADKYGADALRFNLITGNSPGNDMRWTTAKVTSARNFANKLWNASRYILMNLPDDMEKAELPADLPIEDKWVLSRCNRLVKEVTDNIESFELGIALGKLYDFIWDTYCDWYIELTKPRIAQGGDTARAAQNVLVYVMRDILKLLHPFMPFITEEIWQSMPVAGEAESIMVSEWPKYDAKLDFTAEETDFTKIIDAIKAVRGKRTELNVPPSKRVTMHIETAEKELFTACAVFFEKLGGASNVDITEKAADTSSMAAAVTSAARIFMPLGELVDTEKELARLEKEKKAVEKDLNFLNGKLNNQGFLSKAPAQQIENERAKLAKAEEKMKKIEESIAALRG